LSSFDNLENTRKSTRPVLIHVCGFPQRKPHEFANAITKRKAGRMMEYRSRLVDSTQKWLLVPALLILGFSPAPVFLRAAQAPASAPPPPAAETAAQKTAIDGTWQGTLHSGRDYRDVLKITKADDGGYKVVFYLPDQSGNGYTPTNVTVDGPTLKMTLPFGKYAGKLSPDGKTITGSWTQDGNSLPLIFTRATPETEWTIPPPTPEMPPMSADSNPGVEVATIKPAKPDAQGGGFIWDGREIKAINKTLASLICTASSSNFIATRRRCQPTCSRRSRICQR
jgi:hypothetical protein